MSSSSAAVLSSHAGGIARLVLNRPERRNALDDGIIAALKDALRAAESDPQIRVVSISGAGPDFCSGADLDALRKLADASALANLADADRLADLFLLIRELRQPVVALVKGHAVAGGCGLATACDLVLAAETATFGYPEVRIGFVPAMVMAILRRNVSEKCAFELVTGGRMITAAEAMRIGLINQIFPDEAFEASAALYLEDLAGRSGSAVQLCKRLLYHQDGMSFRSAVRAGADINVVARMTVDARNGIAGSLDQHGRGAE